MVMASRTQLTKEEKVRKTSEIYVRFTVMLFAIVIGFSFSLIIRPVREGGILDVLLSPADYHLPLVSLVLSYTLIIMSFVRYIASTDKFPMRSPIRFALDIPQMFVYYVTFASTANFANVLTLYVIIFVTHVAKTVLRRREYPKAKELERRTGFACKLAGCVFILWIVYNGGNLFHLSKDFVEGVILLSMFILEGYLIYKFPDEISF